ncbi:hypothetical protein BDF21DRAFT_114766 [Thamnidium elegans]|nr:hypothetical protein BDF21DRAFT_114766 [Thamnidium elegans]
MRALSTSTRKYKSFTTSIDKDIFIAYDVQKRNILSWGDRNFDISDRNFVTIDRFMDRLYHIFKKNRDSWDQDDLFLIQAVSDFMRLLVENMIKESEGKMKDAHKLHYVFVVPSEWEEEIRQVLIRPIFVQANLIAKDDHNDRLLFCSDLEAICYFIAEKRPHNMQLSTGRSMVLCRMTPVGENHALIKLDLVSAVNPLFDFSGSLNFSNVVRSNSFSLTIDDVKDAIKAFLQTGLSIDVHAEIIESITEEIYNEDLYNVDMNYEGYINMIEYLTEPLFIDTSKWSLDIHQKEFIKSICFFDICYEISKTPFNILKDLLYNNLVKEYAIFSLADKCSSQIKLNQKLLNWSKRMVEYYRVSFNPKSIIHKHFWEEKFDCETIVSGMSRYALDAIQNSNMNGKPRIVSTKNLASCLSIFQKSKPDAIMQIDISLESTLLSLSFLDENGLIKGIWNHNNFVNDTCLRPLGSFFSFSEVTTLNVKYSCIMFVENYLTRDDSSFSKDKCMSLNKDILDEIDAILGLGDTKDLLISTQSLKYVKAFVHIYLVYIKKVISSKLSSIIESNKYIKIGYAVTIEKMLLDKLFGTEDDFREVIYASGLIRKDDNSKKLRIILQGEGILGNIRQSLKLQFPLKSFFVLAQLHESYIYLTLNQVVTKSGLDEEDQEAIIIQDEVIHIPHIYGSLSLSMWYNIIKDTSLIQLCDIHSKKCGFELQDIFCLENQIEFTRDLEQYISKNILAEIPHNRKTDKIIIQLGVFCNCRVCLTVHDIIEISFRPLLQEIISLVSTSLINTQLFGKYKNIQYLFHLIRFNYNFWLQPILAKILKDETNRFMYEQRIDTYHYVIPNFLSSQLLQPVLQQRPFTYKAFQAGILRHVYSESHGFGFDHNADEPYFLYRNKRLDTNPIPVDCRTVLLLFKKTDKISSGQTNREIYLNLRTNPWINVLSIKHFKFEMTDKKLVCSKDTSEMIEGPSFPLDNFGIDHDIPIIISIQYRGYSSSLSLMAKIVGHGMTVDLTLLAEPMTLARF